MVKYEVKVGPIRFEDSYTRTMREEKRVCELEIEALINARREAMPWWKKWLHPKSVGYKLAPWFLSNGVVIE